jgi:DNA primase small subunit
MPDVDIKSKPETGSTYDSQDLPQLLQIYYKLLFPHKVMHRWLSYGQHGDSNYFNRREFSLTLPGDVYIRYLSFSDADELKQTLVQKNPDKIDIGAVYNISPKDNRREWAPFRAVERELVFDIDLTDYDDVRNCCSGASVCRKCWLFMVIAAKILHRVLSEDFGFKHIFWIYSGRRGIHCWVSDERARKLSFEARAAIADYLTLIEGGEFKKKKVFFDHRRPIHASVTKALTVVNRYFERLCNEQGFFDDEKSVRKLIDLCEVGAQKSLLEKKLLNKGFKNSFECWERCVNAIQLIQNEKSALSNSIKYLVEEVKLQYCYPRLDVNVSKGMNHLLKAPFSVHPKTGRICIPIDIAKIDTFDPFEAPMINDLCAQIDKYDEKETSDANVQPYEKTSLKESVNLFRKLVNSLAPENSATQLQKSDASMQF